MKKTIVMLSGGPDSATVLNLLKQGATEVSALIFDFGQQSACAEIAAARRQARRENVPLEVIDISGLRRSFLGLAENLVIGLGFRDAVAGHRGNCPHALFGLATSYAMLSGAESVAIGMHHDDHGAPAEVSAFLDSFSAGIRTLHGVDFTLFAPLLDKTKEQVFQLAHNAGISLTDSWSCSRGGHIHCGACSECAKRQQAFKSAGIPDGTEYSK